MLKQGNIELDDRQIQQIYRKNKQKIIQDKKYRGQIRNEQQISEQQLMTNEYELVGQQIFDKEFIALCLDDNNKGSSLKLYRITKNKLNLQLINKRIRIIFDTVNNVKQLNQKIKLSTILRLTQVNNLINYFNYHFNNQHQPNQFYLQYHQEGKSLNQIQMWRFKHDQNKPHIDYQSRQQIFNDLVLIINFISQIINHQQFKHMNINLNNILISQYEKITQYKNNKNKYYLNLSLRYLFNIIILDHQLTFNKNKQSPLIQNIKLIINKILAIPQQKSKRTLLDNINHQKIHFLISLNDITKLTYELFYINPNPNNNLNNNQTNNNQSVVNKNQQLLNQLKQQIILLQQLAKNQLMSIQLSNLSPKLSSTTKSNNPHFWNQINQFILSNLTQSQRKAILTVNQKKPQPNKLNQQSNANKKSQKKVPSTPAKKQPKTQHKPQPKQVSKIDKQKQTPVNNSKNAPPKQIVIQQNYLSSASDIRFRPDKLNSLIQNKQSLLYILKTKNKNSLQQNNIACYINVKMNKQNLNLIGGYSVDNNRKSFIYSENSDKFYKLIDNNYAVGYGPQIFITIGKLDIIVPCFGTQIIDSKQMLRCMSYFPVSYSSKGIQLNQMQKIQQQVQKEQSNKSDMGLSKQFFLQDIDIYQIIIKPQ